MKKLEEWLEYLKTAHSNGVIDMGLSRISEVKLAMWLTPTCPVIVVAGTNGKGSTCAYLTYIYMQAGYKVGTLTSPHLLSYNERIAINAQPVDDEQIVQSFECIDKVRGDISLTYFEFNTLAAVDIFQKNQVDVMILEIGLGGRLDAVNIFDADCSIVTSIDLDHQHFLGDTIEEIAFEKAGVYRAGKSAICGQNPSPTSLKNYAYEIGAELLEFKKNFNFQKIDGNEWVFSWNQKNTDPGIYILPMPALLGDYQLNNASCALMAIVCLQEILPVKLEEIKQGLLLVRNPWRFQIIQKKPLCIVDVGHNPHAARALKQNLQNLPRARKRIAVFSILKDKDIYGVIEALYDQFDEWYIAPLEVSRGRTLEELWAVFDSHNIVSVRFFQNIADAYLWALVDLRVDDRIVAFGSFHVVEEVMKLLDS